VSSKRHLRRTKCERKRKFASADEANNRTQQIAARGGDLLKAYRCRFCGWFHLGHERGSRQSHPSVATAVAF